jgi:hypothetical protein
VETEEADEIARALTLGAAHRPWLERLAAEPVDGPVQLPAPAAAAAALGQLGVDAIDAQEVAASLPGLAAQPALGWLLARAAQQLRRHMGAVEVDLPWPPLPATLGPHGRFFLVYLFLAVLPDVRRWHAAHGVADQDSWETLRSLGRAMRIHRARCGTGGVFEPAWMTLPFRACLYELGRLQYTPFRLTEERTRRWGGLQAIPLPGLRLGDPAVGIHIPAAGPLRPEEVDASLARARAFFGRPEPWGPCRLAVCGSWLLDPQLAAYLPAEANIIRFQRRFTLLPGGGDGDGSIFNFVFHLQGPPPALDSLPQRTTLERAAVAHLRRGLHWQTRTGWLPL